MTRHETQFAGDGELLIIPGQILGPRGMTIGRFVLDTGAVFTTITPELAELVGYGPRDGTRRTRVRTAVGNEDGYLLEVANALRARAHQAALLGPRLRPRAR